MIFSFASALAASLLTAASPQPVASFAAASPSPLHAGAIAGADARAPRYVRLRLDITAYGVPGRGEILVDRATGSFVRRFDAGPVSDREGWDGRSAWRADATGFPRVEGNVDERGAIGDWSRLLAPGAAGAAEAPRGTRAPDAVIDGARGLVAAVTRYVGGSTERTAFSGYRTVAHLTVPFAIADTSDNGTWSARVRDVDVPASIPASAFAPPPEPRDATLDGVTTVALEAGAPLPIVPVSINGGRPLRFLLDTGGQNVITPAAAQRLGLAVVGTGTVGGAGEGVEPIRFTRAASVRVGGAEMRDQPFVVLEFGAAFPADGIVGYELLARFAARLDFGRHQLELAQRAKELGADGIGVPMVLDERQPQVEGSFDGLSGAMTLDTGSASAADVCAPFVRAHDLIARYRAVPAVASLVGVGGVVRASLAVARELRLGDVVVSHVALQLVDAHAGALANPTIAANIGDVILRKFTLVFDYRGGVVRFVPVPSTRSD